MSRPLAIVLVATLLQQICATLSRAVVPLIAPAIVSDLAVSPALVGVFLAISSVAGVLTTLICGGFIVRYGALRMTQIGMLSLGGGLALSATGWVGSFAPGGFASGLGQAVSTPASSHLLGRFSPPHLAPMIFSLKQTGVPAGLMLAGVVAPALVEAYGWQAALLFCAAVCAAAAVALQPLRARFDTDRDPAQPITPAAIRGNIAAVLREPALRLCATMFSFVGLQALFTGFSSSTRAGPQHLSQRWPVFSTRGRRCRRASAGGGSARAWCGQTCCSRCSVSRCRRRRR